VNDDRSGVAERSLLVEHLAEELDEQVGLGGYSLVGPRRVVVVIHEALVVARPIDVASLHATIRMRWRHLADVN